MPWLDLVFISSRFPVGSGLRTTQRKYARSNLYNVGFQANNGVLFLIVVENDSAVSLFRYPEIRTEIGAQTEGGKNAFRREWCWIYLWLDGCRTSRFANYQCRWKNLVALRVRMDPVARG